MVIKIDRKAVAYNVSKAERIAHGIPISIMLKGFYEWLYDIECIRAHRIYSQSIPNSVSYALRSATGTPERWLRITMISRSAITPAG